MRVLEAAGGILETRATIVVVGCRPKLRQDSFGAMILGVLRLHAQQFRQQISRIVEGLQRFAEPSRRSRARPHPRTACLRSLERIPVPPSLQGRLSDGIARPVFLERLQVVARILLDIAEQKPDAGKADLGRLIGGPFMRQLLLAVQRRFGHLAGVRVVVRVPQQACEIGVELAEFASVRRIPGNHFLMDFGRLTIAGDGFGGVPEVGFNGKSLDVADLLVGRRQFLLETGIASRALRQVVEIFQRHPHHLFADRRRARQSGDVVVEIEDKAMGETPDLLKSLLGDASLVLAGNDATGQHQGQHGSGANRPAVAAHEFASAVSDGVGPGADGQAVHRSLDVFGQLADTGIAAFRLLAQGHPQDVVEIFGDAGRGRVGLADGALDCDRRHGLDSIGQSPGQQFVQHDAERIDIAQGANGASQHLLRAGVGWRHRLGHRGRHIGVRIEQLSDSEIEQLGMAIAGHQNVGRLQIPVDNQVAVGIADGRGDFQKQIQFPLEGPVAGGHRERPPFDKLHHQIRSAVFGLAAVEQTRDVRMREAGEHLPLTPEPVAGEVVVDFPFNDLDGHALVERSIVADGFKDRALAALAKPAYDSVRSDFSIPVSDLGGNVSDDAGKGSALGIRVLQ